MTIYFPLIDTTILHVQKTGGTHVRKFANEFEIVHQILLSTNDSESNENIIGSQHTNRFFGTRIAFARDPREWYLSYWVFKTKRANINYRNSLDVLWHGDYLKFIKKVYSVYKTGYMSTEIYDFFYKDCDAVYPLDQIDDVLYSLFSHIPIADINALGKTNQSNLGDICFTPEWKEPADDIIRNMEKYFFDRLEQWKN